MKAATTYTNPVYKGSFPDPFVLKYRGDYFAYCTGFSDDGRVFGVLHSKNLVNWEQLPGAMDPLNTGEPYYWAPEVTYYNGKFYLYYSVGNETLMAIRVAVSDRPDGGFVDVGKKMTTQDFAIDAHVFQDDDMSWYMFYATDFLDHSHVGTGTVVDRMLDPFTLEGNPRPVTRAKYDWQVYDPNRLEKGGVRWHTVEGPFLLKRKGIYYELFSGGNWQNLSYGVSFAITDSIESANEWPQHSDGEKTFPILRTIPERVIGPGHNSVVVGPNNRELYCVYHSWVDGLRVMAIDRMDFAGGNRLFIVGPTHSAQRAPFKPQLDDHFNELSGDKWGIRSGDWKVFNCELLPLASDKNQIVSTLRGGSFRCDVWVRFEKNSGSGGFCLVTDDSEYMLGLDPQNRLISLTSTKLDRLEWNAPDDLDFSAAHHVRLDVDRCSVRLSLDNREIGVQPVLDSAVSSIGLFSEGAGCFFSAFSSTFGFEELFENDAIADRGWEIAGVAQSYIVENRLLKIECAGSQSVELAKSVPPGDHEFALNLRWESQNGSDGLILLKWGAAAELVRIDSRQLRTEEKEFQLPEHFNVDGFHQFRFLTMSGICEILLDGIMIGSIHQTAADYDRIEIEVRNATIYLDMIRYTLL